MGIFICLYVGKFLYLCSQNEEADRNLVPVNFSRFVFHATSSGRRRVKLVPASDVWSSFSSPANFPAVS